MTPIYAMKAGGRLTEPRGENQLDSGAYFYEVYECSDGQYICIASIEAKFHAELLQRLEIAPALMPQWDRSNWSDAKDRLTALFKTGTRDGWCHVLEGTDVCFAPVLSMDEAHEHPHNAARAAFIDVGGMRQPAPAPRFATTQLAHPLAPGSVDPRETLRAWGLSSAELAALPI
jgi:alpha-methylacyl-CoA racemase